jgi:hypothetical protein
MKLGDLVKINSDTLLQHGTVGIITSISEASVMFPYEVVSVTFSDTHTIEGIPGRWVEVVNDK